MAATLVTATWARTPCQHRLGRCSASPFFCRRATVSLSLSLLTRLNWRTARRLERRRRGVAATRSGCACAAESTGYLALPFGGAPVATKRIAAKHLFACLALCVQLSKRPALKSSQFCDYTSESSPPISGPPAGKCVCFADSKCRRNECKKKDHFAAPRRRPEIDTP